MLPLMDGSLRMLRRVMWSSWDARLTLAQSSWTRACSWPSWIDDRPEGSLHVAETRRTGHAAAD